MLVEVVEDEGPLVYVVPTPERKKNGVDRWTSDNDASSRSYTRS